jgi:hypothetical protein
MAEYILTDIVVPGSNSNSIIYTGSVYYNGTAKSNALVGYSLATNNTASAIHAAVWDELLVVKTRIDTAASNILASMVKYTGGALANIPVATNDTLPTILSAINTKFGALTTANITYPGANLTNIPASTSDTMTTILTALNTTIGTINTNIAAISPGISEATLATHQTPLVINHVSSGITHTGSSSLNVTYASGVAYITGKRVSYAGGSNALTASKDNYTYVDQSGTIVKQTVTIGDPAPSTPANTLFLFKHTTDASSVTATVDSRILYPHNGTQLADNSIIARHITSGVIAISHLASAVTDRFAPATPTAGSTIYGDGSNWQKSTAYIYVDTSNTRVGIAGSTSPAQALDVNGGIKIGTTVLNVAGSIRYTGGTVQRYDGSSWDNLATDIDELADVSISAAATNDVLSYSGSAWINKAPGKVPVAYNATAKAVDYPMTTSDTVIHADTTVAALVITLPAPASVLGRWFVVGDSGGNAGANNITINGNGGNIKGAATYAINANNKSVMLFAVSPTNWLIIE